MTDERDNEPSGPSEAPDEEVLGLEIDERQIREMRAIFGTSLPQYLEPLEQMANGILSGTAEADVVEGFRAAAGSLRGERAILAARGARGHVAQHRATGRFGPLAKTHSRRDDRWIDVPPPPTRQRDRRASPNLHLVPG